MSDRTTLKSYFETGDTPTQAEFADLIDSAALTTETITTAQANEITANTAKNSYPSADATKLSGIEAGAEVNDTSAEIKTKYESNANTNAFTDSEKTNLSNQSGTNTGDQDLSGLQDTLVSGTNIKTVNSQSLLGSGNIVISGGGKFVDGTDPNEAVYTTGNVGIGTTNPTHQLDVHSSSTTSRLLVKTTASGNVTAGVQIVCNDSDLFFGAADDGYTAVSEYTGKAFFQSNGGDLAIVSMTDDLEFYAGGRASTDKHMVITGTNNGRVGIGTASPSAKLHVKGSTSTSATTSLLLQNSSGQNTLATYDNGVTAIGNKTNYLTYPLELKGIGGFTQTLLRLQSYANFSGAYVGMAFTNSTNGSSLSSEIRGYRYSTYNSLSFVASGTRIVEITPAGLAIGTITLEASAILQADSTTKGLLPPRMTTTQKNAISTPAEGLVVYDTTTQKHCGYDGTTWNNLY